MTGRLRALFFCTPLALLFGPPALVLWLGGELISAEQVVGRLSNESSPVLHGAAYTNATMYVKSRMLTRNDPQLLVLGSSRVMQFRDAFFLPEVRFYNAGGMVARLLHFGTVLQRLREDQQPELLLLGMDAYFFNERFDKLERDALNAAWLDERMNTFKDGSEVFFTSWRAVWTDLYAGKVEWTKLGRLRGLRDRFGLNAVCRNQGFRNDGSYRYGSRERNITDPAHRDFQFGTTLQQIATGKGRFVYGSTVSAPALREMESVLDNAQARGIQVVGFLPPYPHKVWEAMEQRGDNYAYLWSLEAALRPLFEGRGFEFHNFSDFAWVGADDSEAIDGFHGSEKTYLRLLISMLRAGSRLNQYSDLPKLEAKLGSTYGNSTDIPDVL
jgi:hypothetical protein